MSPNHQLLVDIQTILPKVEGRTKECCHNTLLYQRWYLDACKNNNQLLVDMYEEWIRKDIWKAKCILANDAIE